MSTFEEVLDVFGGSPFPDDYRADHDSICKHLQSTLPKDQDYSEANAAHDLLSSLYHAHRGDNNKASSFFEQIINHKHVLPRRWEFRCLGYEVLHRTLRRYPSVIRFRSEDWSLSQWVHNDLFSFSKGFRLSLQVMQSQSEISEDLSSSDLLESKILFQYLRHIQILWFSFQLCSAHPLHQWMRSEDKERLVNITTEAVPKATLFVAEVFQKGFVRLAVNMTLRIASLLHGCGRVEESNQLMSQILQICIDAQDDVGQALCKMNLGDMASSPPFSSPIALNLVALDGNSYNHANQLWDTCEDGLILSTTVAAEEL